MHPNSYIGLSKFITKILRHCPEQFGIKLNVNHACLLEDLYNAVEEHSDFTREQVSYVILTSKWNEIPRFKIYNDQVKATYKHTYYQKKGVA
jgi:putative RNA 2'-phosphotransferase